jgi:hypothetical protein
MTGQESTFMHDLCAAALATRSRLNLAWWYVPIVVAQAIIESGWGRSNLASQHNNLFGMKFANQPGARRVDLPTREVVTGKGDVETTQPFAAFDSVASCLAARTAMFNKPRYQDVLLAPTLAKAVANLMNDGYSTDRPFLLTRADGKTQAEIEAGPRLCVKPGCKHYAGALMIIIAPLGLDDEARVNAYASGKVVDSSQIST